MLCVFLTFSQLSREDQGFQLRQGCEIVIATPGRLIDVLGEDSDTFCIPNMVIGLLLGTIHSKY